MVAWWASWTGERRAGAGRARTGDLCGCGALEMDGSAVGERRVPDGLRAPRRQIAGAGLHGPFGGHLATVVVGQLGPSVVGLGEAAGSRRMKEGVAPTNVIDDPWQQLDALLAWH